MNKSPFLRITIGLTNLPNRPALSQKLKEVVDQANADGREFAVLSVDLDQFKEANDVFGHVVGDELFCAIARRLEQAVGHEFIARVGGDEFIVLATDDEQPQSAAALANRVLKAVAEDFDIRGQKIPIGLSIGAALYPSDGGGDIEAVLANADAAGCPGPRPRDAKPCGSSTRKWTSACANVTRYSTISARPWHMASSLSTTSRKPRSTARCSALKRCCAGSPQARACAAKRPLSRLPSKTA